MVDLLAEVYTKDGVPELILVHIDVQKTRRANFPYRLPDMQSDDWRNQSNSLAPAFAAVMKNSALGRVTQKFEALLAIARLNTDDARKALLANVVERFIVLQHSEADELRERIEQVSEAEEVKEMISVYEERGIKKGKQEGITIGIEQGLLLGQRRLLTRTLTARFGALPESVRAKIEAVSDAAVLDMLAERAATAATLDDVGLS